MSAGELVEACRILEREGLTTAFGHVSERLESGAVRISPNPGPGLVGGPEELLEVTPAGEVVSGDASLLAGETPIHLAIYELRSDVAAVCRFHGPACLAYGTLGRPLPATTGMGLFLGHEVPCVDTASTLTSLDAARPMANMLGTRPAVLLRGFGAVTVGASVGDAVARAWLLERSARAFADASAVGPPREYGAQDAAPFLADDGPAPAQLRRVWTYLRRKAEAE